MTHSPIRRAVAGALLRSWVLLPLVACAAEDVTETGFRDLAPDPVDFECPEGWSFCVHSPECVAEGAACEPLPVERCLASDVAQDTMVEPSPQDPDQIEPIGLQPDCTSQILLAESRDTAGALLTEDLLAVGWCRMVETSPGQLVPASWESFCALAEPDPTCPSGVRLGVFGEELTYGDAVFTVDDVVTTCFHQSWL